MRKSSSLLIEQATRRSRSALAHLAIAVFLFFWLDLSCLAQPITESLRKAVVSRKAHFAPGSASLDENTMRELREMMTSLRAADMCPIEIMVLSSILSEEEYESTGASALRAARQWRTFQFLTDAGVPSQSIYYDGIVSPSYVQTKGLEPGLVMVEVVGLPPISACSPAKGKAGLHFYPGIGGA